MTPFPAHSLCFRLVVVHPSFIASNDSQKEVITFCFKVLQKFFTGVNTSLFEFWSQVLWHSPCRHFVTLEHIMNDP
jgi:hypothetical protein